MVQEIFTNVSMRSAPGDAVEISVPCLKRFTARAACVLALAATSAIVSTTAGAQQRQTVTGIVRDEAGFPMPDVRVRISAQKLDTILRTGARGSFSVSLPHGPAHFKVTRIGFEAAERDVEIFEQSSRIEFEMRPLPQRLSTMNVREDWVGIRGVVGDDSTMDVLGDVAIKSMKRSIRVVTDSLGRFEFSLPRRELTSMTLTRDGYMSKPFIVPMDSNSADVVILMQRGRDPIHMKQAVVDMQHRLAFGGIGMFALDNSKLTETGEMYVNAAIMRSGMMTRKNLRMGTPGVFIDGEPGSELALQRMKVSDVELIEVWEQDADLTRTLSSRMTGGGVSLKGGGGWIVVWRKNAKASRN